MKLGRITLAGPDGPVTRLVSVLPEEGRVVDLSRAEQVRLERKGAVPEAARRSAAATFPSSMAAAISLGSEFVERAHQAEDEGGEDASLDFQGLQWVAALDPPVIRDSLTFPMHMKQFGERLGVGAPNPQLFRTPGYFKGSTGVVYGTGEEIPFPSFANDIDYELELGIVVGGRGRNLTPESAAELLFGITIFNDFSARDIQGREMGIGMGPQKCKDFAYGIGPWITTSDDPGLPPLDQLAMTVRVNGDEWATGVSEEMIYTPAELIAYVSIGDVVQPGDIIGSGTVGNGSGLELGRYLSPGDTVELEVSGVGVLTNSFSSAPEPYPWWPEPRPNPFETEATS